MMRNYWADDAQLRVDNLDGTQRSEFTHTWQDFPHPLLGDVVLADTDNDGIENVVYATDSVWVVDQLGQTLYRYPLDVFRGDLIAYVDITIIPEEIVPGKALVSVTADSIDVISLTTHHSLPGWPQGFPNSQGLQSQAVVAPYQDTWLIGIYTQSSGLYVWNEVGDIMPGFPVIAGSSGEINDFSVTDINQDNIPEFVVQRWQAVIYVFDIQGNIVPDFPWGIDLPYRGSADDVISLHIENEDSARLHFPINIRLDQNQYRHGIMSVQGSQISEGFPLYNDMIEPLQSFPSSTVIWTGMSDTLHIIHLMPYGYLSRFDLPLPGASVKLIWPMPGGNPQGNRVYNPGPYVGVKEDPSPRSELPSNSTIRRIYPNPGNAGVKIDISLPGPAVEELTICNLLGQVVWSTTVSQPGQQLVLWPGEDLSGLPVSSGRYFAYLSGNPSQSSPITIVRYDVYNFTSR